MLENLHPILNRKRESHSPTLNYGHRQIQKCIFYEIYTMLYVFLAYSISIQVDLSTDEIGLNKRLALGSGCTA